MEFLALSFKNQQGSSHALDERFMLL